MKPSDINVGSTYKNRGAGKTTRTVLAIGDKYRPPYWSGFPGTEPTEPGVLFLQGRTRRKLYISSFAAWAGEEVKGGER
jgi:hypothetical protein